MKPKYKKGDWVKTTGYSGVLPEITQIVKITKKKDNEPKFWIYTIDGHLVFFHEYYKGFELYNPSKLEKALL